MTKIPGLKTTLLSLAITTVMFILVIHFQGLWQDKLTFINYLVYPLVAITAIFAAQFNHSRIALLCIVLGGFLATSQYPLPWSAWLAANLQWLIVDGAGLLLLLALIKDRGLLSVHSLIGLLYISLVGVLVFGWLLLSHSLHDTSVAMPQRLQGWLPPWPTVWPYIPQTLPLVLCGLLLLWRSLRHNSLTLAALFSSFMVWTLNHQALPGLPALPWSMVIVLLTTLYLLTVSIDSYYLAYRDDLTDLPTRRALSHLALSLGRRYTVAMLDIDHFKKFNDTYGHDIGDQVLQLVAAKLTTVKGGGKVFRYGGEEFTLVFPRKTAEQAIVELERLRQAIADYAMVVRQPQRPQKKPNPTPKATDQKTVSVTVSIGVTQRAPKQRFEQALKDADLALYRAKKKGRNNVSE